MFDHVHIACRPFSTVDDKYEIKIMKINIVSKVTEFKKTYMKKQKKRKKLKKTEKTQKIEKITKFVEMKKKIIKSNNKILKKAHENELNENK